MAPRAARKTAAPEARASLARALRILDFYSETQPLWSVEQISAALRLAAPTCYRYVRDLVSAGLLVRAPGGRYALGPRIVKLDYTMRQADPLLRAAPPIMRDLAGRTGIDCVLSALYGHEILDTHREPGADALPLAYGRGRPRPLLQGAAPKVILAAQTTRWQSRLFAAEAGDIQAAGMGATWPEFRKYLAAIARAGYYVSHGELEPALSAIAAPIVTNPPDPATCAIALVATTEQFDQCSLPELARLIVAAAAAVTRGLPGREVG